MAERGANLEILRLADASLSLASVPLPEVSLFAMGLSHVDRALELKGISAVHVILGADVLAPRSAVID